MKQLLRQELGKVLNWRLLVACLFLMAAAYFDYTALGGPAIPEFVAYEANDYFNICYYLSFFLLLLSADLGSKHPERLSAGQGLGVAAAFSGLEVLLYFLLPMLVCIVVSGEVDFSGAWSGLMDQQVAEMYSPWGAMGVAWLLLFARALFLNNLALVVNRATGRPMGMFAILGALLIDWWLYEIFDVAIPWGILPIEHTRLSYTEAAAPAFGEVARGPVWVSLLYWAALIGLLVAVLWVVERRQRESVRKLEGGATNEASSQ